PAPSRGRSRSARASRAGAPAHRAPRAPTTVLHPWLRPCLCSSLGRLSYRPVAAPLGAPVDMGRASGACIKTVARSVTGFLKIVIGGSVRGAVQEGQLDGD